MTYKMNLFFSGIIITLLASCSNENINDASRELSSELGLEVNEHLEDKEQREESILKTGKESFIVYSKNKLDSNEITLEYAFYLPADDGKCDAVYKDSINQLVADFVYAVSDMGEERKRPVFSIEMFKESLPLFNSYYQEMIKDEVTSMQPPWMLRSSIKIEEKDSIVLVATSSYSYTGGAHGNGFDAYTYISKKDGHDMKLNDFFDDLKGLNSLALEIFRKDRGLSQSESLSNAGFGIEDETNFLNDNFYFKNGDIIFLYNQYEIAAYSEGQIEVRIPKEELKRFLK